MVEKKHNKLSNSNKKGQLFIGCPFFMKICMTLFLLGHLSGKIFSQDNKLDDPKWEFGTEVFLRFNTIQLNGLYVSRSFSRNVDLLLKTDGIAGIIRSGKEKVDLTQPNYSELKLDKYAFYLAIKGNKRFKNNTSIYGTIGPYYRKYSYYFESGSLSNFPKSGLFEDTEIQVKSLFGGNVVIKEVFSVSIETPISWFTKFKGSNNNDQYGPRTSEIRSISIRLGLLF